MKRGSVKWFNDEKGFGFIKPEGDGRDVFVHFSVIQQKSNGRRQLENDEVVEYEDEECEKGVRATKVIRIGEVAKAKR